MFAHKGLQLSRMLMDWDNHLRGLQGLGISILFKKIEMKPSELKNTTC